MSFEERDKAPIDGYIDIASDILRSAIRIDAVSRQNDETSTLNRILAIVGDSGAIYISSIDDLRRVWSKLVVGIDDNNAFTDWLLQASIEWRIRAFSSSTQYDDWVNRLSMGYVSHTGVSSSDASGRTTPYSLVAPASEYVAVNDEYMQRLPVSDHVHLLTNNLWYVFILTVQLSISKLVGETGVRNLGSD